MAPILHGSVRFIPLEFHPCFAPTVDDYSFTVTPTPFSIHKLLLHWRTRPLHRLHAPLPVADWTKERVSIGNACGGELVRRLQFPNFPYPPGVPPANNQASSTKSGPAAMDNFVGPWATSPDQTRFASGIEQSSNPAAATLGPGHAVVRKTARWNHREHKVFIDTCELVIAEGHRRGKCFSSKGWSRIADTFNASTGKEWTISQMKNYWNKLRTDHKHLFELLRCNGIKYRSGTGTIVAPDHWWEAKIKENPKYAKYRNYNCSEMYDTYGRLFGDIGDSTKYALSPTKLSQRGFEFGTDRNREYGGDKFPINAEATDSSGSPVEGRATSSMNISGPRSGEKRKGQRRKGKAKKKMFGAREVSASLEQMVSVGMDLASIARSYRKGVMTVAECVDELLSSGHVLEGDRLHLFALWFLRDKENRNSYSAAKTPYLRFKFIEYCFERDNMSINRKD